MDYTLIVTARYGLLMTAEARAVFDDIAAEYMVLPGVDIGPMFGSEGLRIRGKVFAFMGYRSGLIAKLPKASDRARADRQGGTDDDARPRDARVGLRRDRCRGPLARRRRGGLRVRRHRIPAIMDA
jgi:hypothetical protein